jgi:hypothetical protein
MGRCYNLAALPATSRPAPPEQQMMARQSSRSLRAKARKSEAGMHRFFTATNLDRYRRLASGAADDGERRQIMEELAREISAFRREARGTDVAERRPFEDIGSKAVS